MNELRIRQHADGGWGLEPTDASDPLPNALVGIALEAASIATVDPLLRNTILHLLNSPNRLGPIWTTDTALFETPISATSLVMTFLPKALGRLGGLDVTLSMAFRVDMEHRYTLTNTNGWGLL